MKHYEMKELEMLLRVREWGLKHRRIFKPQSMGSQTLDDIMSHIDELKGFADQQARGISDVRRWTKQRAKAREALWDLLRAMRRTSLLIDQNSSGYRKLSLPRNERDRTLMGTGRSFLQAVAPYAAEYIAYEMPEDFISRLESAIGGLERAIHEQQRAKLGHLSATAGIHSRLKKALQLVNKMHVIIRNKVPQPGIVQAWKRASRVERSLRRQNKNLSAN